MKKVLIITYYWPPGASPGVQRWVKFIKYLPQLGWEPVVLTVKNGVFPNRDDSLLSDIDPAVKVYRSKTSEPYKYYNFLTGKKSGGAVVGMSEVRDTKSFISRLSNYIRANYFIPDARKGWRPHANKMVKRIMAENNIAVIITTGPPHSTHLIGLDNKKRTGIPWLVDLRDPWTNIYYNKFLNRTARSKRKDAELEKTVVQTADGVIVVSPGMHNEFSAFRKDVELIYNGFDEEDIHGAREPRITERFSLSYIGNLKHNQDLPVLWNAIAELDEEDPEFRKLFVLNLVGNQAENVIDSLLSSGIGDQLQIKGFVAHAEAVSLMVSSNALLLPIPNVDGNRHLITGKIFEYLASRTPVLAIGPPDGDANKILLDSGRNPMIGYEDHKSIKKFLKREFNTWLKEGKKTEPVAGERHKQFSRKSMAKKLVALLNKIQ